MTSEGRFPLWVFQKPFKAQGRRSAKVILSVAVSVVAITPMCCSSDPGIFLRFVGMFCRMRQVNILEKVPKDFDFFLIGCSPLQPLNFLCNNRGTDKKIPHLIRPDFH